MINVIGGTYREINYDDISMDCFGSGLRSTKFLLENKCSVKFFTSGNKDTINHFREYQKVYSNFEFQCIPNEELITFKYSFALDQPTIYPNPSSISKTEEIKVHGGNVIAYGMLETDFKINGKKVIYDPQSTLNPISFSEIGEADELIYVLNLNEAQTLASSINIQEIKSYFFETERVLAFIIKNGPFGATLFYDDEEISIPSYITNNVSKIGSGDIFTSSFAYYWMIKKLPLEKSARYASKSTAIFCDKKVYIDCSIPIKFKYKEFINKNLSQKQIYLASPFFSLSELILIDKIRTTFLDFGVKVFSPFHDIGIGDTIEIANKDVEAINDSDIIFCVFDNLDSGTLVEAGYSMGNEKKIIGYHRTCDENKLLMLKPGVVDIYNDLTTAIYHTIWNI